MAAEQKAVESTAEEILQREDHSMVKEEASATNRAVHSARVQTDLADHSVRVQTDHVVHSAKVQREEAMAREEASATESQADSK